MFRRGAAVLVTIATLVCTGTAGAQRASLAVGISNPVGGFSNAAGNGFDVAFQVRTEPMIGPLPLRIESGYDFFSGRNGISGTSIATLGLSVLADFGSVFYAAVGPGYYNSTVKTQIQGHNVNEDQSYLGGQASVGANFPVFGLDCFVEVTAMKLFASTPSIQYVPLRFGVRL